MKPGPCIDTVPFLLFFVLTRTRLLSNLTLGLAPDTLKAAAELEPIDFLIRGCGFERGGAMVVGDAVRVGQRFRFMVRGCDDAGYCQVLAHTSMSLLMVGMMNMPASTAV